MENTDDDLTTAFATLVAHCRKNGLTDVQMRWVLDDRIKAYMVEHGFVPAVPDWRERISPMIAAMIDQTVGCPA